MFGYVRPSLGRLTEEERPTAACAAQWGTAAAR